MSWTQAQEPQNRTWEKFVHEHEGKLAKVPADVLTKMEVAYASVKNSSYAPSLIEAECKKNLKTLAGRAVDRRLDFLKKRNDEDEPMEDSPLVSMDAMLPSHGLAKKTAYGPSPAGFCEQSDISSNSSCGQNIGMLGIPASFSQIMAYEEQKTTPLPAKYSADDCLCMDNKLNKENKSAGAILKKSPQTSENLKKVIIKASGKKFLNDFASYLEDVQFYTTNKGWVLSQDKKDIEYYLCNNAEDFQREVDNLCAKNGTSEGQAARMAEIMGALGDKFNPTGKDLKSGLDALVEDINTYHEVRNVAKDQPNLLTRSEYDKVRFSLSRSQRQVAIVNQLTTVILRDKDLNERLMTHIQNGKTPLYGLMEIMSGKTQPENTKKLLQTLSKKYPYLKDKIQAMSEKIGTEAYDQGLSKLFHHALNLHPGLKNILMNPAMFSDVSKIVQDGTKKKGMLRLVEEEKGQFDSLFVSRCGDLHRQFAEAVCTKDADLLSKVNPADMMGVIQAQKDFDFKNEQEALDLLICKMNENQLSERSVFAGLNLSEINPYSASDYLDRKLNPNQQTNGMANLLHTSNRDANFAKNVSSLTQMYNHERVSLSGDQLTKSSPGTTGTAMKFLKKSEVAPAVTEVSSVAPAGEPASQGSSQTTRGPFIGPLPQNASSTSSGQVMPTYAAGPLLNPQVPMAPMDTLPVSSSHEKLKQSFAASTEKEKINQLISSINSRDAQELLDFEASVLNGKEKITSSILEEERKKTRLMEEKFEKLAKPQEASTRAPAAQSSVPSNEAVTAPNFSSGGFVSNSASTSAPAATLSESSGQAAGSFRHTSLETAAISDAKLVISSGLTVEGKQKGQEDPSQDLISYLKSHEPDGQTLKNLKEAGIIYTYESTDPSGKKIKLQKIVKYSELSPEARKLVDNKLAAHTYRSMRRAVSIQALRLELMAVAVKKSLKF